MSVCCAFEYFPDSNTIIILPGYFFVLKSSNFNSVTRLNSSKTRKTIIRRIFIYFVDIKRKQMETH